jgi:hypothetical protein
MRAQGHPPGEACRRVAVAVSVVLLLVACAGPGSSGADPSAAIERAEKALPLAELWDPRSGEAIAKPVSHEVLSADAYGAFVAEDAARARHLDMAAGMGYTKLIAAGRVTYDNGAVLTTAALGGAAPGGSGATDTAMLVIGQLPASAAMPDPPEAVFIARPVFEGGALVRVEFSSEKGDLSLDPGTGQVDVARAEHGSCAPWNCLAGAVYFWWEDNSAAMDTYWKVTGEICGDCVFLPLSQPVTCPLCASFIGAPILASVTNCSIWPCDLCVSDSCFATEYASARCVTENGVSSVRQSTTSGYCENPKTQQSQCVTAAPVEVVEQCPWGCDLLGRSCSPPMECVPSLNIPCPVRELERYCSGTAVNAREQNYRCNPVEDPITHDATGGECTAFEGGITWRKVFDCPYDCLNGACQPPPTCEVTSCEARDEPIGEPTCIVRPDDGASIVQQEYRQYACTPVPPRVAGWPWPSGSSCTPTGIGARVIETCTACAPDGLHCAGPGGGNPGTYAVTGKVYFALSPDAYDVCTSCTFRLSDAGGTFTVTSSADASFSVTNVPPGSYRVERRCDGSTWVAGHGPWDVSLGYAAVTVPTTGAVDVLLPKCP